MKIFERGITIKIHYNRKLTENEQNIFWEEFITFIETINLSFGGGHNEDSFEGYIDLSDKPKIEDDVFVKNIEEFILNKSDLIREFELKKK